MILASFTSVFAQQEKTAAPSLSYSKAELLALKSVKEILSVGNKERDYSKHLVRTFNLVITVNNADGTQTKVSEAGTGGAWSQKQKMEIEKYATKGAVFTLENIVLIEQGKIGAVNQPDVIFSIK